MNADKRDAVREARVVVVGTGTGVGKTHLCVVLLHALAALGKVAVGLKPVESGLGTGESDGERLARASTFHVKHPAPYGFPDPVSPHLAARRAGVAVSGPTIVDWVARCTAPWTIVETAGGLLSPLGAGFTNLDLARALAPDVVLLVGVDRLGVLHEVAACLSILRREPGTLSNPLIVLQAPAVGDDSTGTNSAELVALGISREVSTLPWGAPDTPPALAAGLTLAALLESRATDHAS
jgi:dethiobiotin synthetase